MTPKMASFINEPSLLYVGLAVSITFITYFSLSQRQKDIVFERLSLRGRRSSNADTPPRSLSPEKDPSNSQPNASEYVNTFPPLTRENIPEAAAELPEDRRMVLESSTFDEKNWTKSILGWEEDFRIADPERYIYTGYKIKEIRAMGNFPNYSALSGIP